MLWRVHLRIYESGSYVGRSYPNTYSIYKKLFFYRVNDRGAHLLTVDIREQPLSVGPYIFYVKQTRNNVSREPTININRSTKIFVNFLTAIKYFRK